MLCKHLAGGLSRGGGLYLLQLLGGLLLSFVFLEAFLRLVAGQLGVRRAFRQNSAALSLLGVLLTEVRLATLLLGLGRGLALGSGLAVLRSFYIVLILAAHNYHLVLGNQALGTTGTCGRGRVRGLLAVVGRELVLILEERVLVSLCCSVLRGGEGRSDRGHSVVGFAGGGIQFVDLLLFLVDLGASTLGAGLSAWGSLDRCSGAFSRLIFILIIKDCLCVQGRGLY